MNESQSGDVLEGFSFHQHGQDLGRIYWIFAGSVIPVSYLGYVTRILRFSGDSDSDLLEFVRSPDPKYNMKELIMQCFKAYASTHYYFKANYGPI